VAVSYTTPSIELLGFSKSKLYTGEPFQKSTPGPYKYKLNWSWVDLRDENKMQGLTPIVKLWILEFWPT
jgi:hypothetical protein